MGDEYRVTSSRITHKGMLSNVRVDAVVMPDGDTAEREVVEHANAVGVVALDDQERVVLLRHYRHVLGERMVEIPAGKLDVDGEAPADAARRELVEETGLVAGELVELLHFANSGGWSDESTTLYLTPDARPGAAADDFVAAHEEADLEVFRVPLDEALAMIDRGEISDAKTVIGLLLAHRRLRSSGTPPAM